jgi:hypothetical protein
MKNQYVAIRSSIDSSSTNNEQYSNLKSLCISESLSKTLIFTFSTLATTFIISVGLVVSTEISGYNKANKPVNKQSCGCDCWDGLFRGPHARSSNNTFYKAFYFNYDKQFVLILFVFLFYAQLLKEVLVKLIKLAVQKVRYLYLNKTCFNYELATDSVTNHGDFNLTYTNNIRYDCLFNLIICSYSNYYGIWSIINYLNDRDFRMLNSQLFFSITELLPSLIYFEYLDRFDLTSKAYKPVNPSIVYAVLFISFLHIYLAMVEKIMWGFFTSNYLDANRNKIRDLLLILNDITSIGFCIFHLLKINKGKKTLRKSFFDRGNLFYAKIWLLIDIFLYFFYLFFCSF